MSLKDRLKWQELPIPPAAAAAAVEPRLLINFFGGRDLTVWMEPRETADQLAPRYRSIALTKNSKKTNRLQHLNFVFVFRESLVSVERTASPELWYDCFCLRLYQLRLINKQKEAPAIVFNIGPKSGLLSSWQGARGLPGERGRPGAPGPAVRTPTGENHPR